MLTKIFNTKNLIKSFAFLDLGLFLVLVTFLIFNYQAIIKNFSYDEEKNLALWRQKSQEMADISDRIEIPTLGIVGKISYPQSASEELQMLNESVIHIPGTKMPGEGGNAVFSGHSSNVKAGYYGTIFSSIDRLEYSDLIYLYIGGQKYSYQIIEKKIFSATDTTILENNSQETLTVFTCWPIGTDLRRMAIVAIPNAEN